MWNINLIICILVGGILSGYFSTCMNKKSLVMRIITVTYFPYLVFSFIMYNLGVI